MSKLQLYNHLRNIGYEIAIKRSLLVSQHGLDLPLSTYGLLASSCLRRGNLLGTTRGLMAAVDEFKASRLAFTRGLCGKPLSGHIGAPITKNGLPKVLPLEVRRLLRNKDSAINLIKAILTCLSIGRLVKGGKPIDLKAIEDIGTGTDKSITDPEIILALHKLGLELHQDRPIKDGLFRGISTAGPNGPSLASSLKDLPNFLNRFRAEVSVITPQILETLDTLIKGEAKIGLSKLLGLDRYDSVRLRKLAIKDDREAKSRVFAIFDYGSQSVLSPLHDHLFRILRGISEDCTFDQYKGFEQMRRSQSNKYYYSYDLKSATDRFPVSLQERVLGLLIDKEYASAWRSLMTREPFYLKDVQRPISGGVGQPLGAKSSGAMFTLCHHIIVKIAAIRSNSEAHYILLGDDIVLRGYRLATEYRRIMQALGVTISESKSHVSKDTFEFAKLWSRKGCNVSGFPLVGLAETLTRPLELAALLVFELPTKGYHLHFSPRSLSEQLIPLAEYCSPHARLGTYVANKVAGAIAFMHGLRQPYDCEGAKYLTQLAGVVMASEPSRFLVHKIVREKGIALVHKGLADLRAYSGELARKIPDSLAFVDMDDDDLMIVGSSAPNILQLADHLLNIPLFAALVNESEEQYDILLEGDLLTPAGNLTLSQLEALKLPPKPQLKGFEPVRTKASVRALDLLTREFNSQVRMFMLVPDKRVSHNRKSVT